MEMRDLLFQKQRPKFGSGSAQSGSTELASIVTTAVVLQAFSLF